MKIFGGSVRQGGVPGRVSPGDINGIGDIFDVGCQPSISVRGELKVLPLLRVPHLWLTVRTRAGPGAGPGAGGWSWGWALGRWAGGTLSSSSRARQSRVQAGHHRQAAWLAWVPPPILPTYPYRAGNGNGNGRQGSMGRAQGEQGQGNYQHGRMSRARSGSKARGRQAAAGWGVGRWQGQVKRRGGAPGWWCSVERRARRQGRLDNRVPCPAPCSGPAAPTPSPGPALGPAPGPGFCSPGPGRRGRGCEAAVPTGQGRLGLARPAGGRRRSGVRC